MIIIIDGYNLLKMIHATTRISEGQRSAFINMLGRYKLKRNHKIIVVFDAGPTEYTEQQKQKGVIFIYSGQFQTADDVIVKYVLHNKHKDMLVVTADNEIIRQVQKGTTQVIDPSIFYQKVKDICTVSGGQKDKNAVVIKISQDSNYALDKLMQEAAAMMPFAKNEDPDYSLLRMQKSKNAYTPSKKQQKKIKKIDKL